MSERESQAWPEVIHRKLDVFEFYLRRFRLDENALLQLWSYDEVKKVVGLYVHSVLPLAAATVYVVREWTKRFEAGALTPHFGGTPYVKLYGIGSNANKRFVIGFQELEVVRQLARMVEYRLDGKIPGFGKETKISLGTVSYPRPLLDASSDGLLKWLESENIQILASNRDYMSHWLSGKSDDYAAYIQHWIKANWEEFNEIFQDPIIVELLDVEKASKFEPWDWLYEIEGKWNRETPYLTPGLRIQLLVTVSSTLSAGLTTVTTGAKK